MPAKNQMTTGVIHYVDLDKKGAATVHFTDGRSWLSSTKDDVHFVGHHVMIMVKGNRIVKIEDVAE